eukprot:Phypoly_transcript_06129.p1 GENE.Phypoly_transcript_06129~~Phypoly_transcript_06129.p1  ORF type:complete len:589 (+),score=37.97 Phypoly_transcript_06129:23-1768(+)
MRQLTVLSLLILICEVFSQQCVQFDQSYAPISGDTCKPYLSSQVWISAANFTLEDSTFNSTIFWRIKPLRTIVSFSCFDALTSLLCNNAFPACSYSKNSTTVSYPCASVCTNVNIQCGYYYKLYNIPPIDCSYTGPTENITYCSSDLPQSDPMLSLVQQCPRPLRNVENPGRGAPCALPCLNPTWTDEEWEKIASVLYSFGMLSVFLQSTLIVHFIADPRCRNNGNRLQLYSFIANVLFCFGYTLGGPDPVTTTWCDNPTTNSTFFRPRCGAQAFLIVVFGISVAAWWAICSYIMFKQLRSHTYQVSVAQEISFILAAFFAPIIPFMIGVKQGVVEFSSLNPYCFVQNVVIDVSLPLYYQYALVYIPFAAATVVSVCFIIATMYKIVQHSTQMNRSFSLSHETSGASLSLRHVNKRLLVWCLFMILYFINIAGYHGYMDVQGKHLAENVQDWQICRTLAQLGLGPDTKCPDAIYPSPISFSGTILHNILSTSIGTFTFFAFATSSNIYRFWVIAARLACTREWDKLHCLFRDEKAFLREKREYRDKQMQVIRKLDSTLGLQDMEFSIKISTEKDIPSCNLK